MLSGVVEWTFCQRISPEFMSYAVILSYGGLISGMVPCRNVLVRVARALRCATPHGKRSSRTRVDYGASFGEQKNNARVSKDLPAGSGDSLRLRRRHRASLAASERGARRPRSAARRRHRRLRGQRHVRRRRNTGGQHADLRGARRRRPSRRATAAARHFLDARLLPGSRPLVRQALLPLQLARGSRADLGRL